MLGFKTHFFELKLKMYYFLISFFCSIIVSYYFAPNLISILSYHFLRFVKEDESDFIFNNIFEVFITYCSLSLYSSCFFNIPLILYFSYSFIKSGLFKFEKDLLLFFFKLFLFLLVFSLLFSYFIILPCLLFFLLSFDLITNTSFLFMRMEIKLYDYIGFLSKYMLFYCFVVFQVPALFFLIMVLKFPSFSYIIKKRKFLILISLILGCLFSSPDVLSLFVVSAPFFFFFEVFIFFLFLRNNYKNILYERVA